MVWCGIRLGKAAHQEEKKNSLSKTMRKAMGNHLALFFPRYDMDCAIVLKDRQQHKGSQWSRARQGTV